MSRYLTLLALILFSSCRPYYIKNKHFDCKQANYQVDTNRKELIYRSLKRAVVAEKDIPDYVLFWKKHRIYVASEYQSENKEYTSNKEWLESAQQLDLSEIPLEMNSVSFCLKTKKDLQRIADKTREDFLHLSFRLIEIQKTKATIQIDNTWITSKYSKNVYLSGGGYTAIYNKIDGQWIFESISESWIS